LIKDKGKCYDLSIYGLDKPTECQLKTKDGKEQVLEIGSNTPTDDGAM
jgi:hypothetical protein